MTEDSFLCSEEKMERGTVAFISLLVFCKDQSTSFSVSLKYSRSYYSSLMAGLLVVATSTITQCVIDDNGIISISPPHLISALVGAAGREMCDAITLCMLY